jgi:hypothetical protein
MVLGPEALDIPHFGQQHPSDDWAHSQKSQKLGAKA